MRRFGNWAVAVATLMMLGSVGMKALTEPGPGATRVAPAAAAVPAAAPAQTATPQAPASGYVGAETCVGCHTGYDGTVNATKHGFTGQRPHADGQPGLRVVPRSGRSARQRSGEGEAGPVRQGGGRRRQRAVPDLPQPRRTRALGRQPAREPQREVRRLPQRAREPGPDADARQDPAAHLREVPPDHHQQAAALQPHAGARRQDGLLVVPQRARLGEREAAARRHHGGSELHQLPHREARSVPVGARAGGRQLHHLPRLARQQQRPHAGVAACRSSASAVT